MNNKNIICLCTLVALWVASSGNAATLSLQPASSTVAPGADFSVDLVISGLVSAGAPALGGFDIDIGFNPFALSLVDYSLGADLGDVGLGEALDASFGEVFPGVFNVAQVSFLSVGTLEASQPASFVLATFDFTATGLGAGQSTTLAISGVPLLGDALGDPLAVDGVSSAVITAIPLPAALWLFAAAIGLLPWLRRIRPGGAES